MIGEFERLISIATAIPKLRDLIIGLAVRGRLAPGVQLRRQPSTDFVVRDNSIAAHWQWLSLSNFSVLINGDRGKNYPSKRFRTSAGVPFVNAGHLVNGTVSLDQMDYISPAHFEKLNSGKFESGDILFCLRGSLGKAAVVPSNLSGAIASSLLIVRPDVSRIDVGFCRLLLTSDLSRRQIAHYDNGTAQPNLSGKDLGRFQFPVPPLAEQKRIVAKVDQLMALCDELEAKQNAQRQLGTRLTRSALDALTTATTPDEFTTAWHRLCKNFEAVLPTVVEIAAMKRKVGELAVRGLLTSRSAKDTPYVVAHASLSKVTYEPVAPAEYPYDVPPSWTWLRFGELGNLVGGGTPSKANDAFWRGTIPWVSPKDMKRPIIDDAEDHISDAAVQESSVKMISNPSLLFVVRGMILAHSFPVALTSVPVTVNQDMKACVFHDPAVAPFVLLLMQAARDRVLSKIERSSHGTCRLDAAEVARMPIAIPPLTEQREILEQVTRLSRICDELSARLEQSESCAANLAASLVQQLVSQ